MLDDLPQDPWEHYAYRVGEGESGEREYSQSMRLRSILLTLPYNESAQWVTDVSAQKGITYSPADTEILWQTIEGREDVDIADDLGWQPSSVRSRQLHVYNKIAEQLDDTDRAEVAELADAARGRTGAWLRDLRGLPPEPRAQLVFELLGTAGRIPQALANTVYYLHCEHWGQQEVMDTMHISRRTVARWTDRAYIALGRYMTPDLVDRILLAKAEAMAGPPYTARQVRSILRFRSAAEKAAIVESALYRAGDDLPNYDRHIAWEELVAERPQKEIAESLGITKGMMSTNLSRVLPILGQYFDTDIAEQLDQQAAAAEAPPLQPRPERVEITALIQQVPIAYRERYLQQLSRRAEGISLEAHRLIVNVYVHNQPIAQAGSESGYKNTKFAQNVMSRVFRAYGSILTEPDLEAPRQYQLDVALQHVPTTNLYEQEYLACRLVEGMNSDDAMEHAGIGNLQAQRLDRGLERMRVEHS